MHQTNDDNPAKITVLATGERCLILAMGILQNLQEQGLDFDVVNARFIKPLDEALLKDLRSKYVITLEDNVQLGGFGSMVCSKLNEIRDDIKVKTFAYRDEFIPQGSIASLQSEYGVNCAEIEEYIKSVLA